MWEPVVINNTNYLLKCKITGLQLNFLITNFKEIWVEQLSQQAIANRFQELNPLFDTTHLEEEELVQAIVSMIKNTNGDISLTESDHEVIIEFRCKLLESLSKFKFNMQKGDEAMYFTEFTLPLMQSVQHLEMRQKKLFDLLEKKDKEIEEHVLENGQITRKVLVTKKFNRNDIMEKTPNELLVGIFGKSKQFFESFSLNYDVVKFNTNAKKEGEPVRKKLKIG